MHSDLISKIIYSIFSGIVSNEYVLIKKPLNFPKVKVNSDLDFFTKNIDNFILLVSSSINELIKSNSIKVNILIICEDQIQYDIFTSDDRLLVRLDLYASLPKYQNISLRSSLFESVIEGYIIEKSNVLCKVPNLVDDCILRYLEYVEYYSKVPDKIKHAQFIIEKLESNKSEFYNRLHYYTSSPKLRTPFSARKLTRIDYMNQLLKRAIQVYQKYGFIVLLNKIVSKFSSKKINNG